MPRTPLTANTARRAMDAAAASLPEYPDPDPFAGRGVVIPGGGPKYFPSAWVCINMLRHVGCSLPIELWHLGPDEMSDEMRSLVEPLGVRTVDACEVRKQYPVRQPEAGGHAGWELKPYSIIHSRFREVLFLDADNMPVVDPTSLFDTPQYQATGGATEGGAVFWPDPFIYMPEDIIWKLTGVAYRREWQFESGQIVVDKRRCLRPLQLALWMNEHADFWYQYLYGDKDTFHFAWRKLGYEYAMPAKGYERIQGVMCHHDFDGRRIFQHRHGHKWVVDGRNPSIPGLLFNEECMAMIDELRRRWRTRPGLPYEDASADLLTRMVARSLTQRPWVLRIGDVERPLTFGLSGLIEEGATATEKTWDIELRESSPRLSIKSDAGPTHLFEASGPDRWVANPNGSPVELVPNVVWPIGPFNERGATAQVLRIARDLCAQQWVYEADGDARTMRFSMDGHIAAGHSVHERYWNAARQSNVSHVIIRGDCGYTCVLSQRDAQCWLGRHTLTTGQPVALRANGGATSR